MVAKPMQGDGPIYEYDPPITLGEMVATCEDDHGLLLALAMARAWPEGVPYHELEPWQRIGPDVLWMVCRQDMTAYPRIHAETVSHLASLRWVSRKGIKRRALARASTDAIERIVVGDCYPGDLAARAVGIRKETFLQLRAEATAFLINCMAVAQFGVEVALGMRPEPRTPIGMAYS